MRVAKLGVWVKYLQMKWYSKTKLVSSCITFGLVFVFFHFIAEAQEKSVLPLLDSSGPLSISGTMVFINDGSPKPTHSFEVRAIAKNLSDLPVLFFRVSFDIYSNAYPTKPDRHFYQNDYFFSPSLLQPGESTPIEFSDQFGSRQQGSSLRFIWASAVLDLVQFTDGTTWGDSNFETQVPRERKLTMEELGVLKKAYSESGDQAFTQELFRTSYWLPALSGLQNVYRSEGLEKAKSTAWSMIEAAERHGPEMELDRSSSASDSEP